MKNCINKFTKIAYRSLIIVIMLALSFMGVFSSPLMGVAQTFAASNSVSKAAGLKLKNLPKSAKLNQTAPIEIPFGEAVNSGDSVQVKVVDPKGKTLLDTASSPVVQDAKIATNNTKKVYELTADRVGTYKVQYTVISNNGLRNLTTEEYKIVVTGEKPVMSFEAESSKYIIPSVTNDDYQIVLPNPTVKDGEGNDVDSSVVMENLEIVVKDSYTNTPSSSDDYATDTNLVKKLSDGHFAFTPNAEADCIYTITYTYTDTTTNLSTTEVFEVDYQKEFKADSIKLGYKFNGSKIPETMELGVETTLPTVNVFDENNSELSLKAKWEVEVVFVPNSANVSKYTLDEGKDYVTVSNSNVFTPKYSSKEGYYKITYKIGDFYGNTIKNDAVFTVNDVKDSTAPTTYAVEDYASFVESDGSLKDNYEIQDVSYRIPTKVATNTEVYLPAIFATDNVTSFKNMKSSFKRVIVPETGSNKTVTTCYKEVQGEMQTVNVEPYETASYKFTAPGTYTVRYEATDEANKYNYKGLNFTIVVEDGFEDTVAPRITLSGVPSTVKSGETISFAKPKVVDYESTSTTSTTIVDKNVEIEYYSYTGSVLSVDSLKAEIAKFKTAGQTSILSEVEDKDNKLSFVAPSSASVNFVCVAYDDANNIGVETRTISIVDIVDDAMPTISTTDDGYVASMLDANLNPNFDQEETIKLPEFVATDGANTKYLEGTVSVYDKDGKKVSVIGAQYTTNDNDNTMTIKGARFIANKSGDYTIKYTINDIGGNYIVKSYVVSINDTKEPTIQIDSALTSVEVGETVKIPTVTVVDDGEILANPNVTINFVGENNPSYRFNNGTLEFTALETGVFTYEYVTTDGTNPVISGPHTIEAKDTVKPVISLDRDLNADKTHPIVKENDEIQPIVLPGYTAEDVLNGIKETKVEVKSPSEKLLKVTETADGFSFVPTVDGFYTINYIAIDNANNQTIESYTLRIGDNIDPSVVIENLDANAPEELKINSNLELKLENIKVSDAGETKTADDLVNEYTNNGYRMFTVTVTGPDGSTVSANTGTDYTYTLSKAGKYKISYTARDKAGNDVVIDKFVEVYADDSSSVISNETWSIVLIIASLAVLAGVVIYFVKTRDKKPTAKKLIPSDKNENKKED